MTDILFLSHRIPHPPNKGDKIRSHHLLRYLATRYRVHLGTFIDDPDDLQYRDAVREICGEGETRFIELNPLVGKLRGLTGLLTGDPITLPFYRSPALSHWVSGLFKRHPIRAMVVYSSGAAQFTELPDGEGAVRLIDFVDVDSQKWAQYGREKRGPMGWIYRREARTLLEAERSIARQFDAGVFVSANEANLFRSLAPESATRIDHWNNGVDSDFFSPEHPFEDPYNGAPTLVFTGAMDYWANVEAVQWFAEAAFPMVRKAVPEAQFVIVGGRPSKAVRKLAEAPGVTVTGQVPDVRPHLGYARAAVAPLRIAQGVQNKVLEAMAMARPVVATSKAIEGIQTCPGMAPWINDTPDAMARQAIAWLTDAEAAHCEGARGRACVLTHYNWEHNLDRVGALLTGLLKGRGMQEETRS
ncbi:MAG: TIGR03087 family PEP-CTERM/XrtA system glycosyltransferase [Magnetococcales bacterium]|nr:TIGR03087 family PEP-CTERM/XrtA system glycosyltransferase [Magnetococcales bacterium]